MLAMQNATTQHRTEIRIFIMRFVLSGSGLIERDDAVGVSWCGSRAEELAELATRRLREPGDREARDLDETLRRQRQRIEHALLAHAPRAVRPGSAAGAGSDTGVLRAAGTACRAGRSRVPLAGDELRRLRPAGRAHAVARQLLLTDTPG